MSRLECVIPSVNLKVFGRAIQSLSKIGDELYFEPLEDGLFLRSVNSSRSAYACFQFSPGFFINYVDGSDEDANSNNDGFRCKLGMKSVMAVFRNLSTIEKTVEKCKISLQVREAKLTFQLYCRHGIIKTHNLSYMECETLQAVFSKDLCPNKLTAQPKLLCDAVLNFQAYQEEVTLIVRPDFVALKNYVEDDPNPSRMIHTELTLVPDEFDHFNVGVDADITFCLKEFRAVLAFSDVTSLPMSLHFEGAGRPITLAITSDLSFEANFVLATLAEEMKDRDGERPSKKPSRQKTGGRSQNAAASKKGKNQSRPPPSSSVPADADDEEEEEDMELAQMDIQDITVISDHRGVKQLSHSNHNHQTQSGSHLSQQNVTDNVVSNRLTSQISRENTDRNDREATNRVSQNCSDDRQNTFQSQSNVAAVRSTEKLPPLLSSLPSQRTVSNGCGFRSEGSVVDSATACLNKDPESSGESNARLKPQRKLLSLKELHGGSDDEDTSMSPVVPLVDASNSVVDMNRGQDEESDEEEEDETILGTPPSKKFRSLFFGTQSSTQSTQPSQANATVLAPNSDSDD